MVRPTKRIGKFNIYQPPVKEPNSLSIVSDGNIDNLLVTDKLITSVKTELPSVGYPGQIVLQDGVFYGWSGDSWSILGGEGFQRLNLQQNSSVSSQLKTTIIEGVAGQLQWGARLGGVDSVDTYSNVQAALNDNDTFLLGTYYYSNPLIVYNADGTIQFTLPNSSDTMLYDSAFIKYSSNGIAELTGRAAGDSVDSASYVKSVALNNLNESIVVGEYENGDIGVFDGTQTFITTLPFEEGTMTGYDCFIIKYTGNNLVAWATKIATYEGGEFPEGCAISDSGNVLVTVQSNSTIVKCYNSGLTSFTIVTSDINNSNVYIANYNNNGAVNWVTKINSPDMGRAALSDMNNDNKIIVNAASISGTINAYNIDGSVSATLSPEGFNKCYGIFTYSSSGTLLSNVALRLNMTDLSYNIMTSIKISSTNEILAAGYYTGYELNIYDSNNMLALSLPSSTVYRSSFLVKWDSNGTPQWATRIQNGDDCSVSVNDQGDIVITGYYGITSVYIYERNNTYITSLEPLDWGNVFMVKYTSAGIYNWSTRLGPLDGSDYPSVALNNLGNLIVTGPFTNSPFNAYNSDGNCALTLDNDGLLSQSDQYIVKYHSAGQVSLGNPTKNGQSKLITSDGPTVLINTAASIEGVSTTIRLNQYENIQLMWDSTAMNWIVLKNDGELL